MRGQAVWSSVQEDRIPKTDVSEQMVNLTALLEMEPAPAGSTSIARVRVFGSLWQYARDASGDLLPGIQGGTTCLELQRV